MPDERHHVSSFLMRESLVDKDVMASTASRTPPVRMLPDAHVVKLGGRSIMDRGRSAVLPLVDALGDVLTRHKLILGTGGGVRSRHVFSIGLDLGLPTGVLAQVAIADALGNAHILGTLLAPLGVVAIPPELFGHLLPLFLRGAPGVIFNGDPPYSLWEHPPGIGRIPPHRTDAGSYLVGECFGCKSVILVKDVDGVYDADPKENPGASLIRDVGVAELRTRRVPTLPFDEVLLDLLERSRLVRSIQVVNGLKPELLGAALAGEHVGTIVHAG
ncbi:MAG TPA: uridylate kinase [Thermoanaerobaculia bacterium]|jgi:molybdenum storage protein|nr:uridylate kinase [Thermoanaerobaculia bacterium]